MSTKYFNEANANTQNQLVTWMNDAALAEGHRKADILRKIIELLIHQAAQSLPTYIDNILSWANDKSPEVKKQVIFFIEELSKEQPVYFPKFIGPLRLLLTDSVIAVQKRVIQAASIVYRHTLLWICKGTSSVRDMQNVWEQITVLKLQILNMVDSDNEGIRTHSIKFLEEVVLLQSYHETDESDFSLDKLPAHLSFIKSSSLKEESEHIFTLLLKFHNSQHISSVNLMACMTTLCSLAKFRPQYLSQVIKALGDLHTTLPPTLSQSQVNSVRKHLKAQLIGLLKHPSSIDLFPQITQLLLDTGMTPQELLKVVPKDRRNKRLGDKSVDSTAKRMRIDSPMSNSLGSDNSNSRSDFNVFEDASDVPKPEPTEESVYEGLNNIEYVVSLVMATLMNSLPNSMPAYFTNVYKPIPNAGTAMQKRSLSKMLMSHIKGESFEPPAPAPVPPPAPVPAPAPVPPPAPTAPLSNITAKIPLLRDEDEKVTLKNAVAKLQETSKAERQMESAVSKLMEETRQEHIKEQAKDQEKLVPPQTPSIPRLKQRVKLLKLQEITRPIPKETKEKLMIQSVARILNAEKECAIGGASQVRAKLITMFASSYTPELRELVLNYILDNPVNRIDLAMAWLYEEFALMQGFNRHPVTLHPKVHEKHDQSYNNLLCVLITQICERGDPAMEISKDVLMRKIYLEAPLITEEAVDYLKHLVTEEKMTFLALELLEEICMMRAPRAPKYITALLSHTLTEGQEIRDSALKSVMKIYNSTSEGVRKVIEKYAKVYLGFIALSSPPPDLCSPDSGRLVLKSVWTDDLYRLCLNLIMALFPENNELISEVARVYGQASPEAKRCVLRCIETPIRQMAIGAPRAALLALLEECPRGAETLLTRIVHILTEKVPPTPDLVARVRELYATRVSDVRFLIPVLNGLTKTEILSALPKLIKLNPAVVKEVFNKILGLQNPNGEKLPVSPAEFLVALHLIDPAAAELKYIIKATALCFAEKQVFTQEVVGGVLQVLVEEDEIPVLLMRSVLQALALYPGLAGLVLNLLQRLIDKEVWSHKVAWEGWMKVCERTLPASRAVAQLLPAAPRAALRVAVPALAALTTPAAPAGVPAPTHAQEPKTPLQTPGTPHEPLPPGMD